MVAIGAAAVALALALGAAVALVCRADAVARRNAVESDMEFLRRAREESAKGGGKGGGSGAAGKLAARLHAAGIDADPRRWRLFELSAALAAALAAATATGSAALAVLAAAAVPILESIYLKSKTKRRRALFSEQLASALPLVAENMRIGMTVETSILSVTEHMDDPLREEFARVNAAVAYGRPIGESLSEMARRAGGQDAMQLAVATSVSKGSGGDLADTIDKIAENVSEKIDMRRHVKALTSDQNSSKVFMAAMPWAALAVMMAASPDVEAFYQTPEGLLVILAVAAVEAVGLYAISKLADIKLERTDPWDTQ